MNETETSPQQIFEQAIQRVFARLGLEPTLSHDEVHGLMAEGMASLVIGLKMACEAAQQSPDDPKMLDEGRTWMNQMLGVMWGSLHVQRADEGASQPLIMAPLGARVH